MIFLPKPKGRKVLVPMTVANPADMTAQMATQRRTVDFDTFDIQVQQFLLNLEKGQIHVAPAYQRQFRWDEVRCSQLIESLVLGIPIPNLFMATNDDNSWDVVDGLQRLSAIVKFAGGDELRKKLSLGNPLVLQGLKKLDTFNGSTFLSLSPHIQRHIETRPLKVVTLSDKSDEIVRFDLFERLNTGGINLTPQEIRSCVFLGKFSEKLDDLRNTADFQTVVRLTDKQKADGTAEECILRFFAFLDRYLSFDHSVIDFLNDYMKFASDSENNFDLVGHEREFKATFHALADAFPAGIMRPHRKGNTPLNLYEGIVVGAALAIRQKGGLETTDMNKWLDSDPLRHYTQGATNNRASVTGRIEFCRDRFLGIRYVPLP
ncbi:MAG: DUF262 domain-containing protein [Negativicutes bacterium]|nr:DUF262 domain-containing protein [Negativicutes bacterium]